MKRSEQLQNLRQIMIEFEKSDKLHQEFAACFELDFHELLNKSSVSIKKLNDLSNDLRTFSYSLINCALDVINKDEIYSESHMIIEINHAKVILINSPAPQINSSFTEDFTKLTKATTTHFFPKIYELSAGGFRLLNNSLNFYVNTFLLYLYQ